MFVLNALMQSSRVTSADLISNKENDVNGAPPVSRGASQVTYNTPPVVPLPALTFVTCSGFEPDVVDTNNGSLSSESPTEFLATATTT